MQQEFTENEIIIILKSLQYFINNADCTEDYKKEFKKVYTKIIGE